MFNASGTINALRILVQPRLIVPNITVKTIRGINFKALREAGYVGAVFDKDNCLTLPYNDHLVPELQDAWQECKAVFGESNVLIVSNSAGTSNDAGLIAAESVSYHLGVPVLAHKTKKPGCIKPIFHYFATRRTGRGGSASGASSSSSSSSPAQQDSESSSTGNIISHAAVPKIIVVGDRLFTDVLMANRMGLPVLSVWTTGLWKKESMFLRGVETFLLNSILRYRARRERKPNKIHAAISTPLPPSPYDMFTRPEELLSLTPHAAPPVSWYWRALASLGSLTVTGTKSLYGLITEGSVARNARREEKAEVDRILQADPVAASRPTAWSKVLGLTRRVRGNPSSTEGRKREEEASGHSNSIQTVSLQLDKSS